MIPDFDKNGNLPVGIHNAAVAEIEERFATNYRRTWLFEGLYKLLAELKNEGCEICYLDGGYITNKDWPWDFDTCIEVKGVSVEMKKKLFPKPGDDEFNISQQKEMYRGTVIYADEPQRYDQNLKKYFTFLDYYQQDDRTRKDKGIIKIDLTKEEFL